jgi:hypothetical protein
MKKKLGVLALACFGMAGSAMAGSFTQSPDPGSVTRGAAGTVVQFLFAGDGDTQDAQADLTISSTADLTIVPTVLVPGSVCAVDIPTALIRVAPPSGAGVALTSTATAYCSFEFTAAAGAALGPRTLTPALLDCAPLGAGDTCTFVGAGINITDAPVATPPVITGVAVPAAPPPTGTIGQTRQIGVIDFTVTAAGTNGGTGSIACTDSDAGNPPVITIAPANQNIATGSTTVADPTVSCALAAAAAPATVNCSINGGAATPFAFTCPAGSAVPPSPVNAILVPANSLWSKLGLAALLAVLGVVFVALRRNH